EMGGAGAAIEAGFMQAQIEEAAYAEARRQESGESVVVGVNRFQDDADEPVPVLKVDPELERDQVARLQEWRAKRGPIGSYLEAIEDAARSDTNLLPVMKEALAAGATVGVVSDALRSVFGPYWRRAALAASPARGRERRRGLGSHRVRARKWNAAICPRVIGSSGQNRSL